MTQRVRKGMFTASAILFVIELMIALFGSGFVYNHIGDLLLVTLLYTLWRTVLPEKPGYSFLIPTGILLFAFGIELMQLWVRTVRARLRGDRQEGNSGARRPRLYDRDQA